MTAPTSIQIELSRIVDVLNDKEELDVEVLSVKTRLERQLNELKQFEIWKRGHLEEYSLVENGILRCLSKIQMLATKNKLKLTEDNINNMVGEVHSALENSELGKLSNLEKFVLGTRKSLEEIYKEYNENEEFTIYVTDLIAVVDNLKYKVDAFYTNCICNVEKCISVFYEIISLAKFTRYEINFTKIHHLIDNAVNRLKSIEIKDHKSSLTPKKRELIQEIEKVRLSFNEKIYENESTTKEDDSVNCEDDLVGKIKEVESLLDEKFGQR